MTDIVLTEAEVRQILYALEPLLRDYDRRDRIPDSDLDNEQPVPEVRGVLLGHLRAAFWARVYLKEALSQ
jgi:hypothetical protein